MSFSYKNIYPWYAISSNRVSSLFMKKIMKTKSTSLSMMWIPILRTVKILFTIFILPRSGSVFCPCLLLLIKYWKKNKTVKVTVSPTYSMLFVPRMWIRVRETRTDTIFRHHSATLFPRIKMLLHKLVPRSWYLVIFYSILPGPVHDNRTKEATASKFKEVYNIPYTSVVEWAFNRCCCDFKVLVSPGIHSFIGSNT